MTLSAGPGTLAVRTIDTASNTTTGSGHSYTLRPRGPTAVATVTALSADTGTRGQDFITSVAAQTVSGTFTGTLAAGEKIQVSADGGTTWVDAIPVGSTWSASGVTLSAGPGTLAVRTIDTASNTTTGSGHSYTLDSVAPTAVATVTALSADTGTAGDFITSVAAQTVSGTFTGTLAAGEKIQVSADGGTTWVDAIPVGSTWSASGVTLSAGPGTLAVRTIDTASNTTTGSGHSYTLDSVAPTAVATVTALSADTGTAGDFITSVAAQTVSGTFTGTLAAGEKIQVSADGGTTWVDAIPVGSTWSASGVTLSAGPGTLAVRTIDTASNTTTGSGHSYTLDSVAPTAVATVTALSADTGTAGDFITSVAAQTVSGTFTGTLAAGEKIQVSADGGTTWVDAIPVGSTWSASGVTLSAGPGTLAVRTIDTASNTTTGSGHSYTLDSVAPTAVATVTALSADTGTAGDFITSVAAQTVSGTFTGTLAAGEKIQVSADGGTTWVDAIPVGSTWSASGVTLSAGPGTLAVRTIDTASNTTTGSGHSYTLDSRGADGGCDGDGAERRHRHGGRLYHQCGGADGERHLHRHAGCGREDPGERRWRHHLGGCDTGGFDLVGERGDAIGGPRHAGGAHH